MKKVLTTPMVYAGIVLSVAALFVYEALACKSLSYDFGFVGYGGTFKNTDLALFGIPVYWVVMILGQVLNIIISFAKREQYNFSKLEAAIIPNAFLLVSFVGGKFLYILEEAASSGEIKFGLGGLSLFGAIFLVPVVFTLVSLFTKRRAAEYLDICTTFGIVLLSFMRIGCFLSGCCGAITIWNETTPIVLPVQLFEVVIDLLLLQFLLLVEKKHFKKGYMYPLFMIGYGICRFVLEFLRKSPDTLVFLSNGQIFALISVLVGIVVMSIFIHKNSRSV